MLALPSPQPSPPPLYSSSLSSSASSASSILLIIVLIIAFSVLASVSFHLLRHLFSPRRSSSPPPPSLHFQTSSASVTPPPSAKDHLVSLSSSSAAASVLPKSPDCAVCLSPFCPRDDLRLLPSCRHAFHLKCIDLWLQSTPSCPLCRSPADACASTSFQTEIELSYSLEHSLEHLVGDQVEAAAAADRLSKEENGDGGEEVAEEVEGGGGGGGRGWLREYLDRVASSASSSFNSLTFSGRLSSHRFDSGSIESVAAGDGRSWDLDGVDWVEESGLAGIYRWFVGI